MVESLLSPVIEKLIDLLIKEAESLKGVHKHVKSLQRELEIIEPLLQDAEAKSVRGELSAATKVWMRQLREEAERIEDVIDGYTYHAEQHRQSEVGFFGSLRKASHCVKTFKTQRGLASEIKDVKESLREIKERGLSYGLRPFEQGGSSGGKRISRVDPRIGSLFFDDEELVGIETLSNELVRSLVEGRGERTVISLVGEGGIGKTTLARKVYKDVVGKGSFDHHAWVTVSQSYDIDKILQMLMTQICPPKQDINSVEEYFTLLRSSLQEKRYVIIFDDVWEIDFWGVVKHALPHNSNGSRILLTTRKFKVKESFNSPSSEIVVKELKNWSIEQTWELFCKKAFFNSYCPPELEQLSHEILSKCHGLPLAIVAVAGLLSKKEKCEVEWKKVLDDLIYEFQENNELSSVSKVLLLSHHDLPHHLKLCFMYFGIFPEDFSVDQRRLCRMWIAEGFIKFRENKSFEKIAEEYLIELIDRNLVTFELEYGFNRLCKVHDLTRELILIKTNEVGFCETFNHNKSRYKEKSRRLVIHDTIRNVLKDVSDFKIRSIALFNISEVSNSFIVGVFESYKLLKVVDFEASPLDSLPKEVGNLLHLKYLNLSGTKVKILPKSIGKLCNLQTLELSNTLVRELPVEINKLQKLRHISVYKINEERKFSVESFIGVQIHEGIKMLKELQTLNVVEAQSGRIDIIKELGILTKIRNLALVKVTAKVCETLGVSIGKMKDLEHLYLISVNKDEVLNLNCISYPPVLLNSLKLSCRLQQLPIWVSELRNLQGLSLNFSRLVDEPLKLLKGLPNLSFLQMNKAYDGEELRFEEGSFPKLKHLELNGFEGLKVVNFDKGTLPLLENLEFGPSPLMKEIPCDVQHLTNLKSLRVKDMPKEFVKALQSNGGSEFRKIKHIPCVTFGYSSGKWLFCDSYKLDSSELLQHLEGQH